MRVRGGHDEAAAVSDSPCVVKTKSGVRLEAVSVRLSSRLVLRDVSVAAGPGPWGGMSHRGAAHQKPTQKTRLIITNTKQSPSISYLGFAWSTSNFMFAVLA
mgnify:CR=1 FL=1